MKAFVVRYDGSWMGGTAFVLAESRDDAIEMVKSHRKTTNFEDIKTYEYAIEEEGVLYNWDGEY